jgi:hypothetical protein
MTIIVINPIFLDQISRDFSAKKHQKGAVVVIYSHFNTFYPW